MELPVKYEDIPPHERWKVRQEYIRLQDGKCYHCNSTLSETPPNDIMVKKIDLSLFPKGFLDHPVHLHHSHKTGMTIGAVHAYCNAVLWQYHDE